MIYHVCIKTMSVKGVVYVHEAYEAKKIKIFFWLCEHITPTSFLYIYILLMACAVVLFVYKGLYRYYRYTRDYTGIKPLNLTDVVCCCAIGTALRRKKNSLE
jgi:hypothetical protein